MCVDLSPRDCDVQADDVVPEIWRGGSIGYGYGLRRAMLFRFLLQERMQRSSLSVATGSDSHYVSALTLRHQPMPMKMVLSTVVIVMATDGQQSDALAFNNRHRCE